MTEANTNKKVTIGIDLGTTYSCVSHYLNGELEVIINDQGERTTPSIVTFLEKERLVGTTAKSCASLTLKNMLYDAKRFIGRSFDDPNIKKHINEWPFKIVRWDNAAEKIIEGPNGSPEVKDNIRFAVNFEKTIITPSAAGSNEKEVRKTVIETKHISPIQVSAEVLRNLKDRAQTVIGCSKIDSAVITVPANFDDNQRQMTRIAATFAGFKEIRLLNEPTAAAMAYGFGKSNEKNTNDLNTNLQNVLVFDLGGGKLDVSIIKFITSDEDGEKIAQVLVTEGDTFLGGVDFDNRIIKMVFDYWVKKTKEDYAKGIVQKEKFVEFTDKQKKRLKEEVEKIKRTLSSTTQAVLTIESFDGERDLSYAISRSQFEYSCHDLFASCMETVKATVLHLKGRAVSKDSNGKYPFTSEDLRLFESAKDLIDDVILVGGSSRIPKIQSMLHDLLKKKLEHSVNPDEAVAKGAAFQAALLFGDTKIDEKNAILPIDCVPVNISIGIAGGVSTPVIKKGQNFPIMKTKIFTTYVDNQPDVHIKVYEGDALTTENCKLLNQFKLSGIEPAPRGMPQIEVTMSINNDGILTVTACDKKTSNKKSVNVLKNEFMSKEELERLAKEFESIKESDAIKAEIANKKNTLDTQIYEVKKQLDAAQNPSEEIIESRGKLNSIESWMHTTTDANLNDYEQKIQELIQIQQKTAAAGAGPKGDFDPSTAAPAA